MLVNGRIVCVEVYGYMCHLHNAQSLSANTRILSLSFGYSQLKVCAFYIRCLIVFSFTLLYPNSEYIDISRYVLHKNIIRVMHILIFYSRVLVLFCPLNYYTQSLADPGGAPRRAPPTGSISFVFAYVFAEKCMRQRLAPPPPTGRRPAQREILDPPLTMVHVV